MDLQQIQTGVIYRVLSLCQEKGLSLGQLAAKAQVPLTTLKNILNGTSNNPGILTLGKLCGGLDITLEEFFAGEEFKQGK